MNSVLLNIVNSIMTVYVFFAFFKVFSKTRYNGIVTILGFTLVTGFFTVTILFVTNFVLRLGLIIALMVILSLSFDMKWYNRIILPIIIYALAGAVEYFVAAVISKLFSIDIETCTTGGFYVLGIFLSKVVTFFIIIIVRTKKHRMLYTSFNFNILPIVIVPASTIMVFILQYNFYLQDLTRMNQLSIISVVCYGLLFVSNIIVFDIIDWIYKTIEQEAKISMAEQLLNTQSEQYRNFFEQQKMLLQMKHDQKNFIIGILTDLKTQRQESAILCLEQQLELLNDNTSIGDINNVFSLLIKYKEVGLSEKNISINFDYSNLKKINIPAIDIAVLLGNAIDNAIEASEKIPSNVEKSINITARVRNSQIIIVVTNPIEKIIDVENLTSTKSSEFHGFGIISMQRIAEKYGGRVLFESEENVFNVCIILENIDE